MTSMLSEWRTRNILLMKKTRLLKWGWLPFFMEWHTLTPDVMLEFVNTFFIKGVDVFGVCVDGYVEESKRHVNKSLVVQTL